MYIDTETIHDIFANWGEVDRIYTIGLPGCGFVTMMDR
jgi:hypothetical protein